MAGWDDVSSVVSAPTNWDAVSSVVSDQGVASGPKTAFGEGLADGIPFGQRITSGIAALGARPFSNGISVSDLYDQAQADTKSTASANPIASLSGGITGTIPTLALGTGAAKFAAAPVYQGTSSVAKALNVLATSLKGGAIAAPTGALYSAGNSQDIQSMPKDALNGAEISGALGTALPLGMAAAGTAGTMATGALARNGEKIENAGSAMYKNAGDLYNQMRKAKAVLNPNSSSDLSDAVTTALYKPAFIPELNPKTTAIVNKLTKDISDNGEIDLGTLDQYRRLLGKFGGSEDGVSSNAVRQAIDNHVNSLDQNHLVNGDVSAVDLLNQGRAQYAQASKFDDIAGILQKASGDPNKIKSGLTRFLNQDGSTKGWTQDEVQSLKDAAQSTTGEKLLKMAGKFGIDLGTSLTPGNTVAPLIGAAVAGAHSGGLGAIIAPLGGTVARQGQKYLARGKAENLLRVLEK